MKDDNIIKKLLQELGILKDVVYSETLGEDIYYIDTSIQQELHKDIDTKNNDINQIVFDLWELEMIDVTFNNSGEPIIALNKNSINEEKINEIKDDRLKKQLKIIVAIFNDRFG